MTTAARIAPAARAETSSKPATQPAQEESHPGLWIITGLIATFAVTIAVVLWMARSIQI